MLPISKYASETWTFKRQDHRKIDVFEIKCWRKVLNTCRPFRSLNLSIRKRLKTSKKWSTWCQLKALGFFVRIVCDSTRDVAHALLLCNLSNLGGSRRRDRPTKGWDSSSVLLGVLHHLLSLRSSALCRTPQSTMRCVLQVFKQQ